VFDKRGRAANVSNTKNAPLWARLWYSTQREGQGTCRTPKTCPQGHVRGVLHEEKGRKCTEGNSREHVEHQKHALVGMFVVSDTRRMEGTRRTRREGKGENAPNIRTRPWGTCSGVRDVPKGRRTCRTPQTDPQGPVCGVRDSVVMTQVLTRSDPDPSSSDPTLIDKVMMGQSLWENSVFGAAQSKHRRAHRGLRLHTML